MHPMSTLGDFLWGRWGKRRKCHVDTLDLEMFREWYLNKIGERYKISEVYPKMMFKKMTLQSLRKAHTIHLFLEELKTTTMGLALVHLLKSRRSGKYLLHWLVLSLPVFWWEEGRTIQKYLWSTPHPGFQSPPRLWTIFSRESQPKPSFVTVSGWGVDPRYFLYWHLFALHFSCWHSVVHLSHAKTLIIPSHYTSSSTGIL